MRFYVVGSVVIGSLLVVDSVSLLFLPMGPLNLALSTVEYLWLLLSVAAIVFLVREGLPIVAPVSYVVYAMLSTIYALYMVYLGVEPDAFRLPTWLILTYATYGAFFAWVSLKAHRAIRRPRGTGV